MKKIKNHALEHIVIFFEIIVGILLLINPIAFTTGIITAAGVILCILGLSSLVHYFRTPIDTAVKEQVLFKGALLLLVGVFCTVKADWFVSVFPVLTILYGACILLSSLQKLQTTVNMIRLKKKRWYLPAISTLHAIICAVVIFNDPFETTEILWRFTGITLIIEALLDFAGSLLNNKEKNVPPVVQ
ncbi:MAG: DUF308 domain-containing protein [Ruminococcaceae bacterium]|nr:DUF308 domain-containing protein [Oscillospiraceae bacterium]